MARTTRSDTAFLRWDGDDRKDIFFRIAPNAIRLQQGRKASVTETLGGYYTDTLYAADAQYRGLLLPDLTIEGTTGVGYRKELEEVEWVWRHASDTRNDDSPVDVYLFLLSRMGPYQGVERDRDFAWLIFLQNFAWDDSASTFGEIKFSLRAKVLRDLFWETEGLPPGQLPSLEELAPSELATPGVWDIQGSASTTALPEITAIAQDFSQA